nr:MAG TPA: hypothetical protein [Bacteriophage sp.]DAM78003.1 MAG TPA: hypothetical protein [Caudoviricetes sp.]
MLCFFDCFDFPRNQKGRLPVLQYFVLVLISLIFPFDF